MVCHIVIRELFFENKNIKYNTDYKISSDYDFYLRHNYKNSLKISKVDGYIEYDNDGISSKEHKIRDKEASNIIKKNFGSLWFLIFNIKIFIKSVLRKVFF